MLVENNVLTTAIQSEVAQKFQKDLHVNGSPVYTFRRLINEMSLTGSDLMVEPFDDSDF